MSRLFSPGSLGKLELVNRIVVAPVPFAASIRKALGCPVICAGLIADARHADAIIAEGRADFVALARALLDDPRWSIHAASRLAGGAMLPPQYQLAAAGRWPLAPGRNVA